MRIVFCLVLQTDRLADGQTDRQTDRRLVGMRSIVFCWIQLSKSGSGIESRRWLGKKCKQVMTRSLLHHQFSVRQVGDGEDCFSLDAHYCAANAVSSVSDSQTGGEEEEMGGGWSRRVGRGNSWRKLLYTPVQSDWRKMYLNLHFVPRKYGFPLQTITSTIHNTYHVTICFLKMTGE